jgi:hypothetical protein
MGWFLRKSFRLGPLRLNLSKRGIGASMGVKGARLGVDATGKPYVAGGRYGLYFRQRLGPGRVPQIASESQPSPAAPPTGEIRPSGETSAPSPRGRPWWVLVLLALLIGIILGVVLARAGEPTGVNLLGAPGPKTSTMSHRTGHE